MRPLCSQLQTKKSRMYRDVSNEVVIFVGSVTKVLNNRYFGSDTNGSFVK